MGLGRGAAAGRQDEFLQPGQLRVVVGQRFIKLQQGVVLEQFIAGNGQLATEVEQLVLHIDQQFAHVVGQGLAQQQADVGIELVHIAHGVRAAAVLGDARVVAQARAAVVSGARGDLCQTVAHGRSPWRCGGGKPDP